MSATFDKLKQMLEEKGALTNEEIGAAIAASGEMTADETVELEAQRIKKSRAGGEKITMEQYLAASKVLDTAPEGSDEYKNAEKIVEKYESGQ